MGALIRMLAFVPLIATLPAVGRAQATTAISYDVGCRTCRLVMDSLGSFGAASDPVLLAGYAPVRDGRGRVYGISFDRNQVVAFSASGAFMGAFGAAGDGPGEFSGGIIQILVGLADTLLVLDNRYRLSVFDPSLKFVRSARIPSGRGRAVMKDGSLLIAADVSSAGRIGFPLHVIGSRGDILRSVGPVAPAVSPVARAPAVGLFFLNREQTAVWRAGSGYSLEEIPLHGSRGQSVRLTGMPWMTNGEGRARVAASASAQITARQALASSGIPDLPVVQIEGIDAEGRFWILASRHEPNAGDGSGVRTTLDIVDLRQRQLVLSHPWNEAIDLIPHSDLAFVRRKDANGVVTFVLYRLRIVR